MKPLHIFIVASVLLSHRLPAQDAAWPDFLPQTRLHRVTSDPPTHWAPDQGIVWQAELPGDGQSSPVVWNDRVVTTSVRGEQKEQLLLTCWDLAGGQQLWLHQGESSLPVKNSLYVSRAAPTPVADDAGVVVLFESGDVVALDWDGKVRWQVALTQQHGAIQAEFGLAASLAQHGELVYALIENDGPSYLLALDKASGQTRWKAERPSVISWTSPAVMTLAGLPQVVVSSVGTVASYDAASGETLWSLSGLGGNTVATPCQVDANRLIIGASPGRGEPDTGGPVAESNLMLQVNREGDSLTAEVLWRSDKARASFSSPLAYQGVGYWVNRAGVVFAIDLETATPCFTQRIDQAPWATAIGVGQRVYFFGKDGVTTVIRAGKKYEKLASNTLWDPAAVVVDTAAAAAREDTAERRAAAATFAGPTLYGVAVAGDSLLIRTGNRLYRIMEN